MSKHPEEKILTIPNILSILRIALIPFIVWLYVYEENYIGTGIIVVISGLTDVVDGFIARHYNQISDFGKIIDPIADKLTQITVLIVLVSRFRHLMYPLVLFLIKEVVLGLIILTTMRRSKKTYGAEWHGKMNTVILYAVMFIHLFYFNIPLALSYILTAIVTVSMLVSFVLYLKFFIKLMKESPSEN